MRVRYVGELAAVEVVHPDPDQPDANTVTVCPHGETVDLPDDQATSLIAAGTFEPEPRRRGKNASEQED
jgi:hypothetical protein